MLAGLAVVAALWGLRDFLIPVTTSATLAVLLWPAVRRLDRVLRVRGLSALVAVLATLCIVASLSYAVGTKMSGATEQLPSALRLAARDIASLGTESARAMQRTRSALTELDRTVARATGTTSAPPTAAPEAPRPRSVVTSVVDGVTQMAIDASKSAIGVLLQTGIIALLTFFMLCGGEALSARLTAWCTSDVPSTRRCAPLLIEAARQIRLFAGVTVVTNVAIGLGVALGFAAFGVPDAWMWGLATAALHFLPYAGLAMMMAVAALEVYVVQASVFSALLAALCVMGLGIVIGTAMTVWLQGRAAKIDSASLFAGTVFWSVIWGGWGLLLGPFLVVLMRLLWVGVPTTPTSTAAKADKTEAAPGGENALIDGVL